MILGLAGPRSCMSLHCRRINGVFKIVWGNRHWFPAYKNEDVLVLRVISFGWFRVYRGTRYRSANFARVIRQEFTRR